MGLMLECALIPRRQWSPALRHDLKLFYRDRRPKQEATIWLGRYELLSSWPDMPAFASVAKVRSDSGYDGTLSWLVACYALFAVGRWEAPRRLNVDPAGLGGPAQRTALYLASGIPDAGVAAKRILRVHAPGDHRLLGIGCRTAGHHRP